MSKCDYSTPPEQLISPQQYSTPSPLHVFRIRVLSLTCDASCHLRIDLSCSDARRFPPHCGHSDLQLFHLRRLLHLKCSNIRNLPIWTHLLILPQKLRELCNRFLVTLSHSARVAEWRNIWASTSFFISNGDKSLLIAYFLSYRQALRTNAKVQILMMIIYLPRFESLSTTPASRMALGPCSTPLLFWVVKNSITSYNLYNQVF